MSDLGGVTAGSTPSPAPQLRNRLARLSLTFVESNLDMKALIEDNSNFPVATETVTPVITRRSFKVQRPKPISTTPSSPRASTSVFSGRRPNQQPSMDGMMTPSSVLSNADSLSGVGVLDSPVKSRVVTPFRPPQQKTVITPRSAIVKSRSMSPSKRVTFSDGAVVIPDHSSQSSAPSRPAAVVDVTRDKRMALRRVYKRIDSARAELQSCLVKKRAVTLLSVLPPEVQGRVYPQLLDTKLPKDVIDECIHAVEQLHQKVLLFSVGCVVEDITSTHSGSLALIQRHSRLQCALTAALAAGVNDAAEASRSLQRFSVELFDGFSKAFTSLPALEECVLSCKSALDVAKTELSSLLTVAGDPIRYLREGKPSSDIEKHSWHRSLTEWESLGRLHESTLIAPSPSALPSAEDLEAGIASKAAELEYLQSQQADLCQLLYALRLDVSSKLDREETHNESLMKSIVSLEEKLAKLSHLLVTGPDELRHGDGVTKKALVSIRLRGVEGLLKARRHIKQQLSRVRDEGRKSMADAEAGSLNTCSLNTQSFVNVLHEKSELLEAQREVLMDRIDQVQADINTATAKLIYEADDGVGGRKLMERKSLRAALMREWKAQKVPVVDRTAAMSQIVDAAPYSVAVHTAFRTELTKLTTLAAEESSSLQKSRLRDSIGRLEHAVTHNAGGRSGTWTKLRDSVASPAAKASLFDVVRSMMPQNRSRTPTDKSYRDVDVVDATTFGIANVPSNYSLSPSQAAASTARLAFLKRELSELSKLDIDEIVEL